MDRELYESIFKKYNDSLYRYIINSILTLKEIWGSVYPRDRAYWVHAKLMIKARMREAGYSDPEEIKELDIKQAWWEFLSKDPEKS